MDTFVAPVLLFLIFAATAYYVLVPFLSPKVVAVGAEGSARKEALELRKVSLYKQLREVEFEREMGLINDEDFERTRMDLMTEVAEVLGELEGAAEGQSLSAETQPEPARSATCPSCQAAVEAGARFCSNCGTELGSRCPQCGAAVVPGDRFCSSCGRGLLS